MICKYAEIDCWKMWVAFAVQKLLTFFQQKATHIFSAKNIRILCIESAKTVNERTLNELVKLTTLWTTGPWYISYSSIKAYGVVLIRSTLLRRFYWEHKTYVFVEKIVKQYLDTPCVWNYKHDLAHFACDWFDWLRVADIQETLMFFKSDYNIAQWMFT